MERVNLLDILRRRDRMAAALSRGTPVIPACRHLGGVPLPVTAEDEPAPPPSALEERPGATVAFLLWCHPNIGLLCPRCALMHHTEAGHLGMPMFCDESRCNRPVERPEDPKLWTTEHDPWLITDYPEGTHVTSVPPDGATLLWTGLIGLFYGTACDVHRKRLANIDANRRRLVEEATRDSAAGGAAPSDDHA